MAGRQPDDAIKHTANAVRILESNRTDPLGPADAKFVTAAALHTSGVDHGPTITLAHQAAHAHQALNQTEQLHAGYFEGIWRQTPFTPG